MEKAVLKTLIYANLFDFPMTIFEIHKWLIGEKTTLRKVEKTLNRLIRKGKVKNKNRYFFLTKKEAVVDKRRRNKLVVKKYLQKAKMAANALRIVPWIKLVGISGGLSMENASKKDDIDLFIITEKNRIWLSRLLANFILSIFRRKVSDNKREVSGKICLNLFLDTDNLLQNNRDIYTAHEILQMKTCWERDGIYHKFLSENEWVFEYLPNWISVRSRKQEAGSRFKKHNSIINNLENLAKWFQLKIMNKLQGMERIGDGALYFHPQNYRTPVMYEYRRQVKAALDKKMAVE